MIRVFAIIICIVLWGCSAPETVVVEQEDQPIPIKVVVVAMFERGNDTGDGPGEFQLWVERLPLADSLPFPQGYRQLRYNADRGVLGMVTGVGTAKAAASVMALGMDSRFDLSNAYWVIAGISGIDPEDASTGSAAWAEWLVDGDLSHEIDTREIPEDWTTGYIPLRKAEPYEQPAPTNNEGAAYRLNPGLVDWAFDLTKDMTLMDNSDIQEMRALYEGYPQAQQPPKVMKGDQLAAMTYWHGKYLNEWANDWTSYWTGGRGNFVTSAMEDTGSLQALTFLDQAGKVDVNRVLVLRTGSNFTMQYPGVTAAESLAGEKLKGGGYSAFVPAIEAAYSVGSKVVNKLVDDWAEYESNIPGN